MSNIPDEPIFDHDTVHGLTGGPRGADQNARRGGRAGRTVRRAGRTPGRAPGWGEPTPTRSAIQVQINRGGGSTTSRRRLRDPEVEVPHKRQSVEVNSADVTVTGNQGLSTSPARDPIPEIQFSPSSLLRSPGTALGSSSSTRQKVYELLSRPSFLSDLGPGIYCRSQEWIETNVVPLCASVKAALFHPPSNKLVAPAAQLAHDLVVITELETSLESEKKAKAEADKELEELRLKAKDLEDLQLKYSNLETALQASKDEMKTAVEAAAAEARQAAVADFRRSEEFVGLLGERYDGGWMAAKRCVCHYHPDFDWEQMEVAFGEGVHRQPLADEPYICSEEIIANILPTAEDDAPPS
ncbi:hypothetical protein BVRB_6g148400 [Beta vulgaris subsp. vulgaris]|nr:hypothetical protein BVRB_6g148400 [Beta vulgaris subsp. vulgaris]